MLDYFPAVAALVAIGVAVALSAPEWLVVLLVLVATAFAARVMTVVHRRLER